MQRQRHDTSNSLTAADDEAPQQFRTTEGVYQLLHCIESVNTDARFCLPASCPRPVAVSAKVSVADKIECAVFNHQNKIFLVKELVKPEHSLQTLNWTDGSRNLLDATPSCHDIHQLTSVPATFDLLIGTDTGVVVACDLIEGKSYYFALPTFVDAEHCSITVVRWLPGNDAFLCAYGDGTLLKVNMDMLKANCKHSSGKYHGSGISAAASSTDKTKKLPSLVPVFGKTPSISLKMVANSIPTSNPESRWVFSAAVGAILSVDIAPDTNRVALGTLAGYLLVVELRDQKLLFSASSYFGAILCAAWSPDGLYIITGGEDDLVTIWSMSHRTIVARCVGHSCYVTAVAFDNHFSTDTQCYRFGSVGQDSRMCLWDFTVAVLQQPAPRRNTMPGDTPPRKSKEKTVVGTDNCVHLKR